MSWMDTELLALMQVIDELWKLRESPDAQIRILRYVADRFGLPVRIVIDKKFTAPLMERCEEIEPMTYIG